MESKTQIAVFGGGCFWCTEALFKRVRGVISVTPGYSGGTVPNPTYAQVSTGATGHAEAARIEFDPAIIKYEELLTVFFATHDPASLNRQGNDVGTQYRSIVFYADQNQKEAAEKMIRELLSESAKPIVTELAPLGAFYAAENYHRDYYETHRDAPYCRLVIEPKLARLARDFRRLLST